MIDFIEVYEKIPKEMDWDHEYVKGGKYTFIPDDIDTHIPIEIGSFTSIASGLTIVSGQHPPIQHPDLISTFPFKEWNWSEDYPASKMDGKVTIGSDVWIGQGVTLLEGVEIGHGAIIGAGSLVTKDVQAYGVYGGNPAKFIRARFPWKIVYKLLGIAWWQWPDEKIKNALPEMQNTYDFVKKYHEE